jgi:hypothetical protein
LSAHGALLRNQYGYFEIIAMAQGTSTTTLFDVRVYGDSGRLVASFTARLQNPPSELLQEKHHQ